MCITWLQFGIHLDPFGPNFSPTAPWAQVGPSWDPLGASRSQLAQVRRKLKLGPSKYAPVRSNLRPRTGKFDPSRLLVGPSRPAPQRGISGIKPPQVLTEGFNAEMAISGLNPQIRFVYLLIFMQKDGLKGCVLDQLLPSHLWPLRPVLDSYMSWGRYRAVSALTVH